MAVQVKLEQAYAYAELLEILSYMEDTYTCKIPKKLMIVFRENALNTYEKHIDISKPIENQDISPKTAALIGMLTLQYWCESESQKRELVTIFNNNEKKYQENLRKKYNPDNIFNNNPQISNKLVDNIDETLNEIDEIDKISEIEKEKAKQREKERILIAESRAKIESDKSQGKALVDYNSFAWYKKIFVKVKTTIFNFFKGLKK